MTDTSVTTNLLPPDYEPSTEEEYMNPIMLEYFRQKLENWKKDLLKESHETLNALQDGGMQEPDMLDRASIETDKSLEFRTRDRERKLIAKIDTTLAHIDNGEYGYCTQTGEPIGIARMIARPTATLSIEAQEAHERREKLHKDT